MRAAAPGAAFRGGAQASSGCLRPASAEPVLPADPELHCLNFPVAAALPGADAGGRAPLPAPVAASGRRGRGEGRSYRYWGGVLMGHGG